MSRLEWALVAFLGVQILLWLSAEFNKPERSAQSEQSRILINVDVGTVRRIEFQDGKKPLIFEFRDEEWRNSAVEEYPINQEQVKSFLAKIANLKRGLGVSVSQSSHSRFGVSEDNPVLKVVLTTETDTEFAIFFGKSSTIRESYARTAGETTVFAVKMESWELNSSADHWLDKTYLELEEEDVLSASINGLDFEKKDNRYHFRNMPTEEYDPKKIQRFVRDLLKVRAESFVLGNEAATQVEKFEELFVVDTVGRVKIVFLVASVVEGENTTYFVKRNDKKGVYKVPTYQIEKLIDAKLEDFLLDGVAEKATSEG